VEVDGRREDAVALGRASVDLSHKVTKAEYGELARRLQGRTPAETPVTYVADVDAIVSWLPFDLGLPVLAEPAEVLGWRLRTAGLDVSEPAPELRREGYKPGRRVVLRFGEHFLKAYGARSSYDNAVSGLATATASHAVPIPRFERALDDVRLTAQETVADAAPVDALEAAAVAGAIARNLHGARPDGLVAAPPSREVEAARRKADLISAVAPDCAARAQALVRRLAETAPTDAPLVAAHGDFHAGQLLAHGEELLVTDLDDMCAAPAAIDLAEYVAGVVEGDDHDADRVDAVLDRLLAGYGDSPEGLDWYLAAAVLIRASHPFHRQLDDWPARVAAMVGTADRALGS
jgi:hypothetical protein